MSIQRTSKGVKMSNNVKFVEVKKNHICAGCNNIIKIGERCLTVNKYKQGRKWYCNRCLSNNTRCENYKNIQKTKARLDTVSFGDGGMTMALMDLLDEYESECIACGKCMIS